MNHALGVAVGRRESLGDLQVVLVFEGEKPEGFRKLLRQDLELPTHFQSKILIREDIDRVPFHVSRRAGPEIETEFFPIGAIVALVEIDGPVL